MSTPESSRWSVNADGNGIVWDVADQTNPANLLPHADHVEMSGRRVSVIVRYRVDKSRRLFVERDMIFPQLRVRENDVRGYLRRVYDDRFFLPRFVIEGEEWYPLVTPVMRIAQDKGCLTVYYKLEALGITIERVLFPDATRATVWEDWQFYADDGRDLTVDRLPRMFSDYDYGLDKTYGIVAGNRYLSGKMRQNDGIITYIPVFFDACTIDPDTNPSPISPEEYFTASEGRISFDKRIQSDPAHIAFHCPDPELNQLFAFAKLRAAESLFETELMGLVHSPGGGNFYCGIWANDQCEYSAPFFAFLNDPSANEASVNAYRHFAKHMMPEYTPVPSSFEMSGHIPYRACGDRGDAAMIASGMARYLLVRGDRALAAEMYPALTWCNEYNRRKTDKRGVVLSDTDELEGRFPTGDANLSTSTLAYDGYRMGAHIARELGHTDDAADWNARADALALAIEAHFGAAVEGYMTYRYHDGNTVLRSWICLPLVFGLATGTRASGTVDALFSPRLWMPGGLATQAGDTTFWDRSTLYGLRGAFIAGATELAYARLLAYSRRRLLGDHVPYPVEAYPENDQAHLSAESALYCRVFLEGLLGIVPTGFDSFTVTPRLPSGWDEYSARFTAFGGRDISIRVFRKAGEVAYSMTG